MKKSILLFVSVLTLSLISTSCSKNDDNNGSAVASIVGEWEYHKVGVLVNSAEVLNDYVHSTNCPKDYIGFDSGSTYYVTSHNDDCIPTTTNGAYVKAGNDYTTVVSGTSESIIIKELSGTSLKTHTFLSNGTIKVKVYKRKS